MNASAILRVAPHAPLAPAPVDWVTDSASLLRFLRELTKTEPTNSEGRNEPLILPLFSLAHLPDSERQQSFGPVFITVPYHLLFFSLKSIRLRCAACVLQKTCTSHQLR